MVANTHVSPAEAGSGNYNQPTQNSAALRPALSCRPSREWDSTQALCRLPAGGELNSRVCPDAFALHTESTL